MKGQQTCKVCGRPDKFNFNVPNDVWEKVVPVKYQKGVVCLYCFDELAWERGFDYSHIVDELYFAGRETCLTFKR